MNLSLSFLSEEAIVFSYYSDFYHDVINIVNVYLLIFFRNPNFGTKSIFPYK